jgi:hypothetical protein
MKKVILGYLVHRDQEWISLTGPDELTFNKYMKKSKALWTRTHKCYLLPCNKKMAEQIRTDLSKNYMLDMEPLRQGLLSRKQQAGVPERKAVVNTSKAISEYEAGLRDWELRNA